MKFDIEIIVPVTNENKYKQRLEGFKKIGLLNIKNHKVLLTLLIGTEKSDIFVEGWPSEVVVKAIPCKTDTPACKIYDYFAKMTKEHVENIDWFAKIDDDSLNDIDLLLSSLNDLYNVDESIYAVTKIMCDLHGIEHKILKDMNCDYLFKNGLPQIQHEHEGCILSKAAMLKIISSKECINLFERRATVQGGYTDQCLGCAARMVKIHPFKAPFLSSCEEDTIVHSSILGGFLAHIHPVCRDKNNDIFDLIANRVIGNVGNKEIFDKLKNKTFFLIKNSFRGIECTNVVFNEAGSVETIPPGGYLNEKIWTLLNDQLDLLQNDGQVVVSFDFKSLASDGIIHSTGTANLETTNEEAEYVLYSDVLKAMKG